MKGSLDVKRIRCMKGNGYENELAVEGCDPINRVLFLIKKFY